MTEPTLDTLTKRLDRMERENRWWRVAGGAVLAVLVATAASPAPKVADKILAREFILADDTGVARARLGLTFGKPELAFDDDPRALVAQSGTPIEPRMSLSDDMLAFAGKNRTLRLKLGVYRQIDDLPVLVLHDERGRARIDLSVFQGGPSLIIQDDNRRARAILGYVGAEHLARGVGEHRPSSSLVLLDDEGKLIWKAP